MHTAVNCDNKILNRFCEIKVSVRVRFTRPPRLRHTERDNWALTFDRLDLGTSFVVPVCRHFIPMSPPGLSFKVMVKVEITVKKS